MNRKRVAALVLSGSLLLSACAGAYTQAAAQEAEEEMIDFGVAVEVRGMQLSSIENQSVALGSVQPSRQVSVAGQLSAEVVAVYFDVGDRVEAGDILFRVNAQDIQNQVMQLQAAAGQANAGIAQASLAVEQANQGLQMAIEGDLSLAVTELQLEQAIANAQYGAQLTGSAVTSARDAERSMRNARDDARHSLDGAFNARDTAQAASQHATSNLANIQVELGNLRQQLANTDPDDTATINSLESQISGLEISLQHAQLEAQQAAVALGQAQAGLSQAQNALAAVEGQFDSAQHGLRSAGIQNAQAHSGVNSAMQMQEASLAAVEQAQERAIIQQQMGVQNAQAAVTSAQAAANNTQVQLQIAMDNLGRAVVTSPIGGVIANRNVEIGQFVSPGFAPFTVVDMDTVNVEVGVTQSLVSGISIGDEVEVSISALGDFTQTGIVTSVSPVAGQTGNFPVRIELPNPNGSILPGMFAQASFVRERSENTFVVDRSAIVTSNGSEYVFLVRDGHAVRVEVATGIADNQTVEVLSGLSAGDQVIFVGQQFVEDGARVNVVGER